MVNKDASFTDTSIYQLCEENPRESWTVFGVKKIERNQAFDNFLTKSWTEVERLKIFLPKICKQILIVVAHW